MTRLTVKEVFLAAPTLGTDPNQQMFIPVGTGGAEAGAYSDAQMAARIGVLLELRIPALGTFAADMAADNMTIAAYSNNFQDPYDSHFVTIDGTVPTVASTWIEGEAKGSVDLGGWVAKELEIYTLVTLTGIITKRTPEVDNGSGGFTIQAIYTLPAATPNDPTIIKDPASPTDTLKYDWEGVTYGGLGGTAGLTYELYEQSQVDQTLTRIVSNITILPGTLPGRTPGSLHTYVMRVIYGTGIADFVDGAPQTVRFDSATAGTALIVQSSYEFDEVDDVAGGTAQFLVARSIAGPAECTVDIITSDAGHTLEAGVNFVDRIEHTSGITLTRVDASTANCQLTDHGLVTGQHVRVSGASPAAYNGSAFSVIRIDDNNFRYATPSDVVDPDSGVPVVHCGVVWWDAANNSSYNYKVKLIDADMDFWRTAEIHIEDGSETGDLSVDVSAQSAIFRVNGTGGGSGALQEVTLTGGAKGFVLDFDGPNDQGWAFPVNSAGSFYEVVDATPDYMHMAGNSGTYYTTADDLGDAPSADIDVEVGVGGRLWWPFVYANVSDSSSKDSAWSAIDDVVMDVHHAFDGPGGQFNWDVLSGGTTLSSGVRKFSVKLREPSSNIYHQRIILADSSSYDAATNGLTETLSAAGTGEITEDTDNVYVAFGPIITTTVTPALQPENGATQISITQPAEAFFSGASYNPAVHGVITATALIGATPVSVKDPVLEVRPDGIAIRIHPATVWPYGTGTSITFDIQGKLESDGEVKTIDVGAWAFSIVALAGPTGNLFYQDNESLIITSDPVIVRQQLYDGYMAKADVGVYKPLANGGIDYATDFVNDPLSQHGKVLRTQKAGGVDSFGPVLQLRMMLERDTNYPIAARKDDVYLYFDFMMQGGEWPESSKLCGLFCYDLSVGAGDVTGGGNCSSGFGARCSIAHGLDKYPFLGTLVPDGADGSNLYGYNYWKDRNYDLTKAIYGYNFHATDPVKNNWVKTLDVGQRPVGLLHDYWNSVEIRCKKNTVPGEPAGSRYEVKINGFLAVNLVDMISWVPASDSEGVVGDVNNWGIQEGWLQIYHGGGDYTYGSPDRLFYHFDNVTMSESPIGQITRTSPLILAP